MSIHAKLPYVSIGMPVYNGEVTLHAVIDSILAQSFTDFELIISDNASSDDTQNICESYAKNDLRIIYIRQDKNIGMYKNFKYVLDKAKTEYFMWSAADDIHSLDFIELNYKFLLNNSDYVASTSPNTFENTSNNEATYINSYINFEIDGNIKYQRLAKFFKYGWVSHGIFYALVRRAVQP